MEQMPLGEIPESKWVFECFSFSEFSPSLGMAAPQVVQTMIATLQSEEAMAVSVKTEVGMTRVTAVAVMAAVNEGMGHLIVVMALHLIVVMVLLLSVREQQAMGPLLIDPTLQALTPQVVS